MPQIELTQLQYTYPQQSFRLVIHHQVLSDSLIALVGQNGAGKSTIFKLLTGLLTADSGSIKINHQELSDLTPKQHLKLIGITFQNPDDQLFNATAQKEVEWSLSQVMADKQQITLKARAALAKVGLEQQAGENPYDLSLSERKRLTVATVLAIDPLVYLFDEPLMSLDWYSKQMMTKIFHQLAASGHQIMTITHDMDWAAAEFESLSVMANGHFKFSGTPKAFFSNRPLLQEVGLLPPKIMTIAEKLGDSRPYLSVEDYYRQHSK